MSAFVFHANDIFFLVAYFFVSLFFLQGFDKSGAAEFDEILDS